MAKGHTGEFNHEITGFKGSQTRSLIAETLNKLEIREHQLSSLASELVETRKAIATLNKLLGIEVQKSTRTKLPSYEEFLAMVQGVLRAQGALSLGELHRSCEFSGGLQSMSRMLKRCVEAEQVEQLGKGSGTMYDLPQGLRAVS